ncbi:hypothetical protein EIP86_005807 [Pleurotus ostreatoroseus]|nr:hypothetical protein EIP86_005807 [Pleurotus ostreatoroseus]
MVDVSATDSKGSIQIEEISPTRAGSIEKGTYTSRPQGPPVLLSTEEEKRVYREIDLRLIPIMTLLQLLSFMDRGAIQFMRIRTVGNTEKIEQEILPNPSTFSISMWYPRHMLQYRVGVFWGGATIAGAFSGLLAFGISFMDGVGGKEGWSWIFIIEGLTTIVAGIIAAIGEFAFISGFLVDFPDTAKFLTEEEKAYIIWRKGMDID